MYNLIRYSISWQWLKKPQVLREDTTKKKNKVSIIVLIYIFRKITHRIDLISKKRVIRSNKKYRCKTTSEKFNISNRKNLE
jgi:hypothetical protein